MQITDKESEDEQDDKIEIMSNVHSEDSINTKQRKIENQKKVIQRMEKLARMKQMRDDLLKQPDLDPSKLSNEQSNLLRNRDYDAFFFETMVDEDDFNEKSKVLL